MSLNKPEPDPVKNDHPPVWPWVIEQFRGILPAADQKRVVAHLVTQDMAERHMQGIEKYGVALQPHNGRDALTDAYQEALDLCAYLAQDEMEESCDDQPAPILLRAMKMAFEIRERIKERDKA